jgi:ATP-binding cassette subfamily F protein 3
VFSSAGATYFDGTYDEFLEKIGWEDEEPVSKPKKPKVNKQELKKLRSALVLEKSKTLSPIRKEIEGIEAQIVKLEDMLETTKSALVEATNKIDNSKVMELSKSVSKYEKDIEAKFEELTAVQYKLDELTLDFDKKLQELN